MVDDSISSTWPMPLAIQYRRFTLLDAMILIAATAVGFAFTRLYLSSLRTQFAGSGITTLPTLRLRLTAVTPCLSAWSFAVAGLRLRRPRPIPRRIACQPGAAACIAAVLVVAARLAEGGFAVLIRSRDFAIVGNVIGSSYLPGPAIAAVWMNLAIGGRWRPEPSWIDRAGRALGWAWITLFVVSGLLP